MALLLGATVAFLWFRSAPYRSWDSQGFAAQSGFRRVAVDSPIERLVSRARLDFLVSPTPIGRDIIEFMFAKQDATTLYLFFRPRWSHTAVVYAYDSVTRKPLWKTQVDTDPDR